MNLQGYFIQDCIDFFSAILFAIKMHFQNTEGIRYFRHIERKYLYLVSSQKHIKQGEEIKIIQMFPSAITTSKFRFNFEAHYYQTEIVEIMDDVLFDEVYPDEGKELRRRLKKKELMKKK